MTPLRHLFLLCNISICFTRPLLLSQLYFLHPYHSIIFHFASFCLIFSPLSPCIHSVSLDHLLHLYLALSCPVRCVACNARSVLSAFFFSVNDIALEKARFYTTFTQITFSYISLETSSVGDQQKFVHYHVMCPTFKASLVLCVNLSSTRSTLR